MTRQEIIDHFYKFADARLVTPQSLLDGTSGIAPPQDADIEKPVSSLTKIVCGVLAFGNTHPTMILCHHELYWRLYYALIPTQRQPRYDDNGDPSDWFTFNGASVTWHREVPYRVALVLNENAEFARSMVNHEVYSVNATARFL